MKAPCQFLLCFVLALLFTRASAQTGAAGFFNVKAYGAKGNGKVLDNQAIDRAITACAKSGGGTVYLPAGNYLCGSIHLKSNINLFIDAGATITGAPAALNAYDQAEPFTDTAYQDGGHTYFHNSLIWGEHLENVSITGRGRIDGGGLTSKDKEHMGDPTGGSIGTGDKAIAIKLSKNILIRDVTIFHGGHFAILLTGCNMVTLDNLTIDTNRDGIDIDCCINTVVSNCRVNSPNDDAICPKSSYALNRPFITENLSIVNCQVSGFKEGTLLDGTMVPAKAGWSNGRIKFGTESNGGFRNCVVSNCTFRSCNGLALEDVDGGIMENIIVSNITMMDINHYPIYVTLGRRNRGPKSTTRMGHVNNILISNILVTGADAMSGIQITGTPGYPVRNIKIQNISVQYKGGGTKEQGEKQFPELERGYPEPFLLGVNPAYGLFIRHAKDVALDHITFSTLKPDNRPAIVASDVDGLEIDHFKIPDVKGIKQLRTDKVTNLKIDNSPFVKE
ncbi:rhamnogalacturonidase [Mucilaginibacter phyllosphaerae]|uniref:Glycoside hydrolase family 28 protein n=1 Tax=Mucilaginibacter phyllosphaerae TaxID=1812349 RepID=A0A4Y8AJW6_9SPHI|nr:glycoside hydrolase family 28 protein [Mucilaginibacter phyllosphaerae]MBB3967647.1 polygalacturonase [Mucilaginibacter phyllosphaerae]TEW69297.1 glycoside hydrolase family 28 protein [Mucilaginibacter phyllosphaerae]GGH04233.1 exo-poly-alpha-D-galacturonosidase [Mucilaginibacter phyllosphaerae]